MTVHVLIPYNFTRNDDRSIEFVGTHYVKQKDVEITLFHVYTPVPEIDIRDSPIMEKVAHNASFLRLAQDEQKNLMEEAKKQLMNFGFAGHRIHCLFRPVHTDIAADIIHLWKEGRFSAVVLNRNPGNIINFFNRSISKRITRYIPGGVHIVN